MTRIITGSHRGRRLKTPTGATTRPTSDRVRESAFSVIVDWAGNVGGSSEQALAGLSFLDLYAGSAAMALEAASRGAGPVTAVESDPGAARVIAENIRATGLPVEKVSSTVSRFLEHSRDDRFDVIWADPPYDLRNDDLDRVLAVAASRWLVPGGLMILERASRDPGPNWPEKMTERWQRRYGETTLYFAMEGS